MQERGPPTGAHPVGGGGRGIERRGQIASVGAEIRQAFAVSVTLLDPAAGRLDADADPVVLADEQQRHRHALIRRVQRGVDRADRGGVVRRRVAEAAHRDRIVGPCAGHPELLGAGDGERDTEGARQMRRDGRRLRNDVQVVAAEHLVPPTRRSALRWPPPARAAHRAAARGRRPVRRGPGRRHPTGSAAAPDRWAAVPPRPRRCPRARTIRWCSSPCPASAAIGRRGRDGGCRAEHRTAPSTLAPSGSTRPAPARLRCGGASRSSSPRWWR